MSQSLPIMPTITLITGHFSINSAEMLEFRGKGRLGLMLLLDMNSAFVGPIETAER